MKKLRIVIADDHAMLRQGVRSVIEAQPGWEVCGEAEDGRKAVQLVRTLAPDIAILDITMPGLNGVDATRLLKTAAPNTRILILTMHESDALADEVIRAGGSGYLLKSDASEMLPEAIRQLSQGRNFLSSQFKPSTGNEAKTKAEASLPLARLSLREREIVQLLAEGKSNKQVADALDISSWTVETHRKKILHKLNLHNTAELVRFALRNNLAKL